MTLDSYALQAGCAWASITRLNFAVDEALNHVDVDVLPLVATSFDVDSQPNWTFSGFVGFHLENGTVRNLRRRVRRRSDCKRSNVRSEIIPVECRFSIRGLVARYDVEVTVEESLSLWKGAEVHVDGGDLLMWIGVANYYCKNCSRITNATVENASGRLKPLNVSMNLPEDAVRDFNSKMISQTLATVSHTLSTAYKSAASEKMAVLHMRNIDD
ncbi:uncharacterized protein LOC144107395 [Amblyomma americanum]